MLHRPARHRRRPPAWWAGVVSAAVLLVLGSSCARNPSGTLVTNQKPHVRVTGGAVDGDHIPYGSTIYWAGWDDDGVIDHYQYALDVPDSIGIDRINGAGPAPTIAWHDTTVTSARFLLRADLPETIQVPGGGIEIPEMALGKHSILVRAIDNEGAVSDADYVAFTATNVTPKTKISTPNLVTMTPYIRVGKRILVGWAGIDPDRTNRSPVPVRYEYKVFPIPNLLGYDDAQYAVTVSPGPSSPWYPVPTGATSIELDLPVPDALMFAIRAFDEAGGVEDHFVMRQNVFKMETTARGEAGRPTLTVKERTLDTHRFPDDGPVASSSVYVGRCLNFEFKADMTAYGGVLNGYNYGVDVPDAEADGVESGFLGWTLIPYTIRPVCFNTPGVHTLTIKCRDTGGAETIGTYVFNVRRIPPRDREVLYVDDYYETSAGNLIDTRMDRAALDMLVAAGYSRDEIRVSEPWGTSDLSARVEMPTMDELGRYRLIVWQVSGTGGGFNPGVTALLNACVCGTERLLQAYLNSGGEVWVYGQRPFAAAKVDSSQSSCRGDFTSNSSHGLDFAPGTFLCEYMHLCQADIRLVAGNTRYDGLVGARPTLAAAQDGFPALEADSTTYNAGILGGLPFVEAMFASNYDLGGGLDTLYTMVSAGGSPFNHKPLAFRYADPDPVPAYGPIAFMALPLDKLKPGSADAGTGVHGMARKLVEWFKRHQGR